MMKKGKVEGLEIRKKTMNPHSVEPSEAHLNCRRPVKPDFQMQIHWPIIIGIIETKFDYINMDDKDYYGNK